MKTLIIFSFLFITGTLALDRQLHTEWHEFKLKFGKKYTSHVEESRRLEIYLENKRMISEHNERYKNGEVSYELGMNHFGDLSDEDFQNIMNMGLNLPRRQPNMNPRYLTNLIDARIPAAIDWRAPGAVTEVKNQGNKCGSCWAFSATGALEGQYFLKTGQLISLSEQNLIDCSIDFGNAGCEGGIMDWAFQYVIFNGGLDTEASYPYEGVDGKPCRYEMENVGVTAESYIDVAEGDEVELQRLLATKGPVSVAMDAFLPTFQFYKSGVFYERKCNSSNLNHAILAVGYNTSESNEDYWILKNSWGPTWGDSGYFKIARNRDNHCGVASMASVPLIESNLDAFSTITG